ncbi:hypothetical protein AB0E85_39130 [Streptomyces sp. NPDC029044]|uniref:hypothetical protein n=1 Tax=Streptomyces sp. NPDC029044 TaxID=3157198 RepID=UPI0033FF1E7D
MTAPQDLCQNLKLVYILTPRVSAMVVPENDTARLGDRLRGEDVPQLPYGSFAVVLGSARLVQVLDAAVDQAGVVAVRQSCQGGDCTAARLFAVAVVMRARCGVDVQQGADRRGPFQGALLAALERGRVGGARVLTSAFWRTWC